MFVQALPPPCHQSIEDVPEGHLSRLDERAMAVRIFSCEACYAADQVRESARVTVIVNLYPTKSHLKQSESIDVVTMYLSFARSRKLVRLSPDREEHLRISSSNSAVMKRRARTGPYQRCHSVSR